MLTAISLQNFKCYKDKTKFPLSRINLLTGINGKGKSTFLQSILLFKQTVEHNSSASSLLLNGDYVRLGTFQDVKNAETSQNKPILLEFEVEAKLKSTSEPKNRNSLHKVYVVEDHLSKITLSYKLVDNNVEINIDNFNFNIYEKNLLFYRQSSPKQLFSDYFRLNGTPPSEAFFFFELIPKYRITNEISNNYIEMESTFDFSLIHFVSADRLGPQEYYPKHSLGNFLEVGKQGQKTLDVLAKVKNQVLRTGDARIVNEGNNILSLVGEWLSYILDTQVSLVIDSSSPYISILKFNINNNIYTPPNVGFGYSYILPIIVAGLVAKEGEILIIENPEAHLHPRAQSRLTNFLAKVASMGVQVFIESHSDHILNALRVAVKKEELASDDVQIFYFANDTESSQPKIFMPKIDTDGRIEEWPDGFFDEWNNNLMELL